MKPTTFAELVGAMDKVISKENEDREQLVYPDLALDMARAARAVYVSCLQGQKYAETQK